MGFASCRDTLKLLSRAAAKSAAARFRQIGIEQTQVDWPARAEMCERCPLRRIHRGVSYCGNPFLQQMHREPHLDGCGCPTQAKAKSPEEHCPLDARHEPAHVVSGRCNCKWCAM